MESQEKVYCISQVEVFKYCGNHWDNYRVNVYCQLKMTSYDVTVYDSLNLCVNHGTKMQLVTD